MTDQIRRGDLSGPAPEVPAQPQPPVSPQDAARPLGRPLDLRTLGGASTVNVLLSEIERRKAAAAQLEVLREELRAHNQELALVQSEWAQKLISLERTMNAARDAFAAASQAYEDCRVAGDSARLVVQGKVWDVLNRLNRLAGFDLPRAGEPIAPGSTIIQWGPAGPEHTVG